MDDTEEKYVWTLWTAFCAIRRNVVVWYHAYTSSISVELVECNTYDVNFIMRVMVFTIKSIPGPS